MSTYFYTPPHLAAKCRASSLPLFPPQLPYVLPSFLPSLSLFLSSLLSSFLPPHQYFHTHSVPFLPVPSRSVPYRPIPHRLHPFRTAPSRTFYRPLYRPIPPLSQPVPYYLFTVPAVPYTVPSSSVPYQTHSRPLHRQHRRIIHLLTTLNRQVESIHRRTWAPVPLSMRPNSYPLCNSLPPFQLRC